MKNKYKKTEKGNKKKRKTSSNIYDRLLGDMTNKFIPLSVVQDEEEIQEKDDMKVVGTQIVPYRYCFELYHMKDCIPL